MRKKIELEIEFSVICFFRIRTVFPINEPKHRQGLECSHCRREADDRSLKKKKPTVMRHKNISEDDADLRSDFAEDNLVRQSYNISDRRPEGKRLPGPTNRNYSFSPFGRVSKLPPDRCVQDGRFFPLYAPFPPPFH